MKKATGIIGPLILLVVVGLTIGGVVRLTRTSADLTATKGDIKRIMQAMHQYHDAHNSFPPAFVIGPDGTRWHSWRALILPYLEPELAQQYRFDEPWNGPHNQRMLEHAPDVFRSDSVKPPMNATS